MTRAARLAALRRRTVLGGLLAVGAEPFARAQSVPGDVPAGEWQAFKDRFMTADGRIIDTGSGGVSHSEGQGWGLLFAEQFDDPTGFEAILAWTATHLRRPHDALHSWKFVPGAERSVPDPNNATDGDLYIAWALARAARRWGAPDYRQQAVAIAQDVLRLLVVQTTRLTLLLPALAGFATKTAVVVNPSYYVFAAMTELAELCPSPLWAALREDGFGLIDRGRFGPWQLPPDWLRVARADGGLSPAPGWPPRCGFDAARVPLQLAWGGDLAPPPPALAAFAAFYGGRDGATAPAWVDLASNATADFPASPGARAVVRCAAVLAGLDGGPMVFPRVADAPDYYSASLGLLAGMAFQARRPG